MTRDPRHLAAVLYAARDHARARTERDGDRCLACRAPLPDWGDNCLNCGAEN